MFWHVLQGKDAKVALRVAMDGAKIKDRYFATPAAIVAPTVAAASNASSSRQPYLDRSRSPPIEEFAHQRLSGEKAETRGAKVAREARAVARIRGSRSSTRMPLMAEGFASSPTFAAGVLDVVRRILAKRRRQRWTSDGRKWPRGRGRPQFQVPLRLRPPFRGHRKDLIHCRPLKSTMGRQRPQRHR